MTKLQANKKKNAINKERARCCLSVSDTFQIFYSTIIIINIINIITIVIAIISSSIVISTVLLLLKGMQCKAW